MSNILYLLYNMRTYLKELWFKKILKLNRNFYCQEDIELRDKCKYECEHCKTYYSPLKNKWDV